MPVRVLHLEQLLAIDELIQSKERQTSETLARALKVSERTIRSDLAFLGDRRQAPLDVRQVRQALLHGTHLDCTNYSYMETLTGES